jgi:hypothetical protein
MKKLHTFESFHKEISEAVKIENYAGRKNTFIWDGKSKLEYQIPYIFPGGTEELPASIANDPYFEGAARIAVYEIITKANDAMNKEVEKVEVAIKKIGDDAVKAIIKEYETWNASIKDLKYWMDYAKPTSSVGVEQWMSKEAKSANDVKGLVDDVFKHWIETSEEDSKPSAADMKKVLDLANRYFNTFRTINGHIIDAMFSQESVG